MKRKTRKTKVVKPTKAQIKAARAMKKKITRTKKDIDAYCNYLTSASRGY